MAMVATVIALSGPPAQAAADAKPCRTPCLSVNVPHEAPEKPAGKPAEKPAEAEPKAAPVARPGGRPRPQATASATPPQQEATREPVTRRPAPSKRCSDINMRAAVGEPLSDEDMKTLRSQC